MPEPYSIFSPEIGLNAWMHKEGLGLQGMAEIAEGQSVAPIYASGSGAMSNPISQPVNLSNILSGSEVGGIQAFSKKSFTDIHD